MHYTLYAIYLLSRVFFHFYADTFLGELGISFLPYMVITDLLCVCYILFWGIKYRRSFRKLVVRTGFLFAQIAFTILATNTVANFYLPEITIDQSQERSSGLSFVSANILKSNDDYAGIQKMITDTDPDVVMLVEYESGHHEHLQEFFDTHYPYKNRDIHAKDYFGNMIYSKYPLTNLAPTVEQIARRYGYATITKDNTPYTFYLIHTSAPISQTYYDQRNKQLDYLAATFLQHQETRNPDEMVIMAGDFNLSPRSPYYDSFNTQISGHLSNVSAQLPLVTTRKVLSMPWLQVHIDHVLTNKIKSVIYLQKIEIPGSDHLGFYGIIQNS